MVSIFFSFFSFFFPKFAALIVSVFFLCLSFLVQIFRTIQSLIITWNSHVTFLWLLFILSLVMNAWAFSDSSYWICILTILISALLLPPTLGGFLFITLRTVSEILPSKGLRGSFVLIFVITFALGMSIVKKIGKRLCPRRFASMEEDEEADFSQF